MRIDRPAAAYGVVCLAGVAASVALGLDPGGSGHDGYVEIAASLAECGAFGFDCAPTTGRSPLYPLLLLPAQLGPPILWTAALNFACLFGAAVLTRDGLASLGYRYAWLAAALVCLNPAMLMLAKNGMPYAAILFAGAWAAHALLRRRHASAVLAGTALYFLHPSLILLGSAVASLGAYGSWRAGSGRVRVSVPVLACVAAGAALALGWQARAFELYGSVPLTSATGSGFQYERARNRYTDDDFLDERIFARAGVAFDDDSVRLSVVRQEDAPAVDASGRALLLADLGEPAFLAPKLLTGLRNTFFSGLFPETVALPAPVPRAGRLLAGRPPEPGRSPARARGPSRASRC